MLRWAFPAVPGQLPITWTCIPRPLDMDAPSPEITDRPFQTCKAMDPSNPLSAAINYYVEVPSISVSRRAGIVTTE